MTKVNPAISKNLKMLRAERKLTQQEIAKKAKISRTYYADVENSRYNPSFETLESLADVLGVSLSDLVRDNVTIVQESMTEYRVDNSAESTLVSIYRQLSELGKGKVLDFSTYVLSREKAFTECDYAPILGQTAAGAPIEYGDPISMPEMIKVPKNTDMVLKINGDSMEPEYSNGDTVFIHTQPDIESGQIGIVEIDGGVTCKKVIKLNSHIELHSLNKKYNPIIIKGGQFRILGRVIGKA